ADALLGFHEVVVDPRAAVGPPARLEQPVDDDLEALVGLGSRRRRAPLRGVEAGPRDAEGLAELCHRERGLLRGDARKLHVLSFAKKAAAFFRMSRSILSSRTSLRSRASSVRSSVVRPVLPLVRSARARSTHCRSADGVRSRSRATSPTLLPWSSTRATAPALNSSVNRRFARRPSRSAPFIFAIVATSRQVSTGVDQAHDAPARRARRVRDQYGSATSQSSR